MTTVPIELCVSPCSDDGFMYTVRWPDDHALWISVPELMIDLLPFMAARILLSQGYNAKRPLVVRLEGADFKLCQAPLGAVAATPLVNRAAPVTEALCGAFTVVTAAGAGGRHDPPSVAGTSDRCGYEPGRTEVHA